MQYMRVVLGAGALGAAWQATAQPILTRDEPHSWTMKADVVIRAWHERYRTPESPDLERLYDQDVWTIGNAAVVFPVIENCASSVTHVDAVEGELSFEDDLADDDSEILRGPYHSGTFLAKWELHGPLTGREMRLTVEIPTTCYETQLNEEAAAKIEWPTGQWPAEAASTLAPMAYVDIQPDGSAYNMEPVQRLVRRWTNGENPRTVKPYLLAKWFAGQLVNSFQPTGSGLTASRQGLLEGLDLAGAPAAARTMRGNQFDMVSLLVACYRAAGLPARVVIGYGPEGADEDEFLTDERSDLQVFAWAEFALYDEAGDTLTWIPVDIVRIRDQQSRMPSNFMERPIEYFGDHDGLDSMIPFSFHYHPPTTVRAYGSPAFWGWLVFGKEGPPERAFQHIRLSAYTTPVRGGEQNQRGRR